MLEKLKQTVWKENLRLKELGLVLFTWGNVSAIDRETGLVVIKPSGIPYETMQPEDMVVEAPPEVESHGYDSWHRGVPYTYACSLSDRQELEVEVVLDGEDYTVLRWQVVAVGEWVFDDSLNVWDGTLF